MVQMQKIERLPVRCDVVDNDNLGIVVDDGTSPPNGSEVRTKPFVLGHGIL